MTHKYERVCWSCGSHNMEKDSRGFRCKDCGATWNPVPISHDSGVVVENNPASPSFTAYKESKGRPSAILARRAARARQKKVL